MDREYTHTQILTNIKDNGRITKKMGKDSGCLPTGQEGKEHSKKTKKMESASKLTVMVLWKGKFGKRVSSKVLRK